MITKKVRKNTLQSISTGEFYGKVLYPQKYMMGSTGTSSEYYSIDRNNGLSEDTNGNNKNEEEITSCMLGSDNMDNNDILLKYLEKVDKDQSELKSDMRERETRISDKMSATEERMDVRLNRIEDSISQYTKSVHEEVKGLDTKIDNRISVLEGKIDSNNKFIISIAISTILAIAGLVLAVILG